MNKYSGSNFDDFLREDGILEEVSERARLRLLTLQIKDKTAESRDEDDTDYKLRNHIRVTTNW
ncbi:MAG: hypothetical protein OXP71_13880 [Candidatus Poribacteria bacterium]|nr:hypothetical protein [Candidatus Poribacteria bacterium]